MNQEDISGVIGSLNLKGVWAGDEVSPASFLLSHKSANPMLHWTRQTTTRVFPVRDPGALDFEVLIHQDESSVHIRGDQGRFLKHYFHNSDEGVMRSFTSDTVPFTVADARGATQAARICLQELLVPTYVVISQSHFDCTPNYSA
jgi:hypothetical protein